MAKRNSNQVTRNLQSAGSSIAKYTGRTTEQAAVALFRWATTDHIGHVRSFQNIPTIGFFDTIRYILMQLIFGIFGAVLTGAIAYVLISYGMPLLIGLIFYG